MSVTARQTSVQSKTTAGVGTTTEYTEYTEKMRKKVHLKQQQKTQNTRKKYRKLNRWINVKKFCQYGVDTAEVVFGADGVCSCCR